MTPASARAAVRTVAHLGGFAQAPVLAVLDAADAAEAHPSEQTIWAARSLNMALADMMYRRGQEPSAAPDALPWWVADAACNAVNATLSGLSLCDLVEHTVERIRAHQERTTRAG